MRNRSLVKGLIASLIILLVLSIVSFILNFSHTKIFLSLFLINLTLLLLLKVKNKIKSGEGKETNKNRAIKFLIIYGIPLLLIGYVIYLNWLPFGFEKDYVLEVGTGQDTTVINKIYLEKNKALSDPIHEESRVYRNINGSTNLVLKTSAILRNATIIGEVQGEGVFMGQSEINFDAQEYNWDLDIGSAQGVPEYIRGNVVFKDGCANFDDGSVLYYPETNDKFEEGGFIVYANWIPIDDKKDFQQIIGHFNWELLQEKNRVRFLVGRMNDQNGPFYEATYPIENSFFNKKHTTIAIYNPSYNDSEGYIELYVDKKLGERIYIGKDKIWKDYNSKNLSLGRSEHGVANQFKGCILRTLFKENLSILYRTNTTFIYSSPEKEIKIPILGNGKVEKITVKVKK